MASGQFSRPIFGAVVLAVIAFCGCGGESATKRWENKLIGEWTGTLDSLSSHDIESNPPQNPPPHVQQRSNTLLQASSEQLESAELFYIFGSRGHLRFGVKLADASTVTRASWRVVSESDDNVTLEISPASDSRGFTKHPPVGRITIQMLGPDRFRLTGALLTKRTATFRRATD